MSAYVSCRKLKVPDGFQELLTLLSREVIINDPESIYDFCLIIIEKLLQIRKETTLDITLHGTKANEKFYNFFYQKGKLKSKCIVQSNSSQVIYLK